MRNIRDDLNEKRIPILEGEPDDIVPEFKNLFSHWDTTGSILLGEAVEKAKLIICVMVPDFVQPYQSWGERCAIIIQCAEEPSLWKNQRLDIGRMEHFMDQGFKVILIDPENGLQLSVEEFEDEHLKVCRSKGVSV